MRQGQRRQRRAGRAITAACAALGALLAARAGGAFHLEDSLRGATRGNPVGGAVQADGWRVTDRRDRLWYAVPRLASGYVEFTVANITRESLGTEGDNEIFAMYEAGYGIAEPIRYAPEFRENHYKCMLRVYSNGETGREGQQKLMWGICPSGAPGYGACGCGSFFEEPFGGNGAWDGSPQRIRVEWGGGRTRYLRNGATVLTIDWSRSGLTFGPSSLHVSLGTSRPSGVGDARLPVGALFSDVVIDGTEGELARCPGAVVPDAGTPPPMDAGVPTMMGNVLEVPAVEDVTVAPSLPAAVYPDVRDLSVGAADSEFYVKFRVPALAGRVVRAQLLLRSSTDRSAEGTGASVYAAAGDAWSESTLTWGARPGPRGARLARADGIGVDMPYVLELPAAAVPASGVYAFAVLPEPGDSNSAHFDSKEVSPARGPILRLTLDPTTPPPPDAAVSPDVAAAPDATVAPDVAASPDAPAPVDVATSPRDATAAPDVAAPRDVATSSDAEEEDVEDEGYEPVKGGCTCRATSPGADVRARCALAVAALALAARRRGART